MALVFIVQHWKSDNLGDDDYDSFIRAKKMEKRRQGKEIKMRGSISGEEGNKSSLKHGHNMSGPDPRMPKTDKQKQDLILEGKVTLVNLNVDKKDLQSVGYEGVLAHFCFLDFTPYQTDPSSYPMFRDLVYNQCEPLNMFTYDLHKIIILATDYDRDKTRALKPSAFIFHESRCGSTLIANALTAMSPTKHIVYSESAPALLALKVCGLGGKLCPPYRAAELFQDVIYLMGRTVDPSGQKRLFFKIQSTGTKYMDVALEAFPDTPWVFLYRDPVQVLMSQFQRGVQSAICVRQLKDIPKGSMEVLQRMKRKVSSLNPFEKCAFHLSTLCDKAKESLRQSNGMGIGINYEDLTNKLIDTVFPYHFQLDMTEEKKERIIEVSGHYSKGRGTHKSEQWKDDSVEKDGAATPKIKEACELFLYSLYNIFETGEVY